MEPVFMFARSSFSNFIVTILFMVGMFFFGSVPYRSGLFVIRCFSKSFNEGRVFYVALLAIYLLLFSCYIEELKYGLPCIFLGYSYCGVTTETMARFFIVIGVLSAASESIFYLSKRFLDSARRAQ